MASVSATFLSTFIGAGNVSSHSAIAILKSFAGPEEIEHLAKVAERERIAVTCMMYWDTLSRSLR